MMPPTSARMSGPRLQMLPSDLDAAAMVTPLDVLLARALWQRYCPARYLDMLDAMEDAA